MEFQILNQIDDIDIVPENQSLVRIHYGPYEAHGVVRHRTERLRGIQEQLKKREIPITMVPSFHWDRLEIEIAGRKIFCCRLSSLQYNTEGNDDPLCHVVVETIMEALVRMIPSLHDYYEFLKKIQHAHYMKYLEEVAEQQQVILEDILDDVVLSSYVFGHHIVQNIVCNAINFLTNYCKQIVEEVVETSAIYGSCKEVMQNVLERVNQENIYRSIQMSQEIVEEIAHEAYSRTKDGEKEHFTQFAEDIIDAAYSHTEDGEHAFFEGLVHSAIDVGHAEEDKYVENIVHNIVVKAVEDSEESHQQ